MVIFKKLDMLKRLNMLKKLEMPQGRAICLLSILSLLSLCSFFSAGCSVPAAQIPDLPKDHPANRFYHSAQQGMLADRVCLENRGNPAIPAGEIEKGGKYTKTAELTAGVFRFRENTTGKKYLGVSFLQYSGFLQIPKVCAWEEKENNG